MVEDGCHSEALLANEAPDFTETGSLLWVEAISKTVLGFGFGHPAQAGNRANDATHLVAVPSVADLPLPGSVRQQAGAVVELGPRRSDEKVGHPHLELLHEVERFVQISSGGDAKADFGVGRFEFLQQDSQGFVVAGERVIDVGHEYPVDACEFAAGPMDRLRAPHDLADLLHVAGRVAIPGVVRVCSGEARLGPTAPTRRVTQSVLNRFADRVRIEGVDQESVVTGADDVLRTPVVCGHDREPRSGSLEQRQSERFG